MQHLRYSLIIPDVRFKLKTFVSLRGAHSRRLLQPNRFDFRFQTSASAFFVKVQ